MSMVMISGLNRPKQFSWRLKTFLAKGPAYLYAYSRWKFLEQWRRIRDLLQSRLLDDATLLRALTLDDPALGHVRQMLAEGRSDAACAALIAHFQTRAQPRFHFRATERLAVMIQQFCLHRILWDYLEDAKLLVRLSQVMRRVGLAELPERFADLLPEAYDYLAPERVTLGEPPNVSSDIYACGCVWWQMLCGRPPLGGGDSLTKLHAAATSPR